MNDFASQLSTMLDDVAAGINPQPNFEAAVSGSVPVVANAGAGAYRFRRPLLATAAAAVLLVGGVAAYQVAGNDASSLTTTDRSEYPSISELEELARAAEGGEPEVPAIPVIPVAGDDARTGSDEGEVSASAALGGTEVDGDTIYQKLHGTAADGTPVVARSTHSRATVGLAVDGAWHLVVELTGLEPGETAVIDVTVGDGSGTFRFEVVRPIDLPEDAAEAEPKEEPKEEPKAEPKVEPKEEPKAEPKDEPKVEPKQEPKEEPKEEPKVEPKEEPKDDPPPVEEPEPVAFTSHLGAPYNDATYMKQVFYGTAPAGAKIIAASDWGSVDTYAGEKGNWEMRLILTGVPDDTVVHVELTASTGGSASYSLVRAAPEPEPDPEPVAFTSNLGEVYHTAEYTKPVLYGTGTPGSVVVATSQYGSADAEVGQNGHWEMWFKNYGVPDGAWVEVRVTNNQSGSVFEYEVQRPEAEEPQVIEFVAHAAFVECDSTPPYNEYWGTAQPGAVITVSSAYGGGQTTANGDGNWEIYVEFPEAPLNQVFNVVLSNSKSSTTYEKAFKRVEPF